MPPRKRARGAAGGSASTASIVAGSGETITIGGNDAASIHGGLASLWREGSLLDCEVHVSDRCFEAHRVVLSSCSAFMRGAFVGGLAESQSGSVTLPDMAPETFEAALQWMYEGSVNLDEAQLPLLLQAAARLQIPLLEKEVERLVVARLAPSNAIGAWILGDMQSCAALVEAAKKVTLAHFAEAIAADEFERLPAPWLEELLASDALVVKAEAEAYEALKRWHTAQSPEPQSETTAKLFRCVRWALLDKDYMRQVNADPWVSTNATSAMIIATAFQDAFHGVKSPGRVGRSIECGFTSAFDKNGVLYHIATEGGTCGYSNPHESGKVKASMSGVGGASCAPRHFVQNLHPYAIRNFTTNDALSWMAVDLGEGGSLRPSHYCLHSSAYSTHTLRSWQLQASDDEQEWTVLRTHTNDASLAEAPMSTAAWPVEGVERAFRHFRILQTGVNSSGWFRLMCSGIELYGSYVPRR